MEYLTGVSGGGCIWPDNTASCFDCLKQQKTTSHNCIAPHSSKQLTESRKKTDEEYMLDQLID